MNEITELQKFDGTGLVMFTADWCGPCKMTKARLYPMLEDSLKDIEYQEVNVDNNPKLSQKYGVMSIPTMILFNGNKMVTTSNRLDDILEKI